MDELLALLAVEGVKPMTGGYHVSIRAKAWNKDRNRPAGIDYGLTLMNPAGARILDFDNSHSFTGGRPGDPYDHEHRAGEASTTYRYDFTGSHQLISDFFDRVDQYLEQHERCTGVRLQFLDDDQ